MVFEFENPKDCFEAAYNLLNKRVPRPNISKEEYINMVLDYVMLVNNVHVSDYRKEVLKLLKELDFDNNKEKEKLLHDATYNYFSLIKRFGFITINNTNFIINLYMLLLGFKYLDDKNYENLLNKLITYKIEEVGWDKENVIFKTFELIIKNPFFSKIEELDIMLIKLMSRLKSYEAVSLDKEKQLLNYLEILEEITPDEENKYKIAKDMAKRYKEDKPIFFLEILLEDNNYIYFNNKMENIGFSKDIQLELFEHIKGIPKEIYQYNPEKNTFIECMDLIFDSDTLQEVVDKITSLKMLNYYDKKSNREEVSIAINELSTKNFKEFPVSEQIDHINLIGNEPSIKKRMLLVLNQNGYRVSEDTFNDLCNSNNSIKSINGLLKRYLVKEESLAPQKKKNLFRF